MSASSLFEFTGQVLHDDMVLEDGVFKMIPKFMKLKTTSQDIFLATYPRSGTTMIGETMSLIQLRGDMEAKMKKTHMERVIYTELYQESMNYDGVDMAEAAAGTPRILKTHLPYKYIKDRVENNNTKVVVVLRNPRDVGVSMYHFYKDIEDFSFKGNWDEYFDLFFKHKKILYGDWLKHVKSYWEVRHLENVHLIFYEDAVDDLKTTIKNLVEFMGVPLDQETVENIAKSSEFKEMKKTAENQGQKSDFDGIGIEVQNFYRKGGYGNWRKYFSKEQDEYVKEHVDSEIDKLQLHFKH